MGEEIKVKRPLGVSILSVLGFLAGAYLVIEGVLFMVFDQPIDLVPALGDMFVFLADLGVAPYYYIIMMIIGIVLIPVVWGLWKGSGWARSV
jgi:hypothetical protein